MPLAFQLPPLSTPGRLPCPRSNAMELAGALQGRVDALRRQIMEAAEAQEAAATVRQRAEAQQSEVGGDGRLLARRSFGRLAARA